MHLGCGFPPGPYGLYGAAEGVSFLYTFGFLVKDIVALVQKKEKPSYGPPISFLNVAVLAFTTAVFVN